MTAASGPLTLWTLFFEDGGLSEKAQATLESQDAMADVRKRLSDAAGGLAAGVKDSLADSMQGVLNTPLSDILGTAWSTYQDLLEYRDPAAHPPGEISVHALMSHTIESTHAPYLEILVTGLPPTRIKFGVRVAITIEAATLKIQDGRIWEVRTGACTAEGSVSCGPATLAERKTKSLALPGKIEFPDGLEIARVIQDQR